MKDATSTLCLVDSLFYEYLLFSLYINPESSELIRRIRAKVIFFCKSINYFAKILVKDVI